MAGSARYLTKTASNVEMSCVAHHMNMPIRKPANEAETQEVVTGASPRTYADVGRNMRIITEAVKIGIRPIERIENKPYSSTPTL